MPLRRPLGLRAKLRVAVSDSVWSQCVLRIATVQIDDNMTLIAVVCVPSLFRIGTIWNFISASVVSIGSDEAHNGRRVGS